MISNINIKLHCENPRQKHYASVVKNSPVALCVYNLPQDIGNWKITDVYSYDSTNGLKAMMKNNGRFVCTLNGFNDDSFIRIFAIGTDEKNNPIERMCLGLIELEVI